MIVKDEKEWKLLTRLCRLLIQAKNVQTANSCYNPCPSYETVIQNSPYVSKLGKKNMQFIRLECYTYPLNNDKHIHWILNSLSNKQIAYIWSHSQIALLSIEWGYQKSDPVGTPSHSGTHWNPDGFLLFVCYHSLDLLVHFCQVATLNYSWKSRKTTSLLILFTNYYLALWHLDILHIMITVYV